MEKDNKTNSDNIKTIDEDEILKNVMKEIEKAYGKGAIVKLGDKSNLTIKAIPTGSLLLDEVIGGGYPKGRIIEIFGPESSGKKHCHYMPLLKHKKGEEEVFLIDAEYALDPNYARKLGVNIDELILAQPDSGEQALDILETLVKSNAIDLVVID